MSKSSNSPPVAAAAFQQYAGRLEGVLAGADWIGVAALAEELADCVGAQRQVFICGNGGSAANATHIANDFLYGISKSYGKGLRVHALPANTSVMTCLANDEGYEAVFSHQLAVMANRDDVLIVLSGSGNSANVLRALETAQELGLRSYAIMGFTGGKAKDLADTAIHFPIDDMQISEDMQLIVAHMIMQWLYARHSASAIGK